MLIRQRLQDRWDIPPDNSLLSVGPNSEQVFRVHQFQDHFQHYLSRFGGLLQEFKRHRPAKSPISIVSDRGHLFQVLSCLEKGQYLLIETFSEKTLSYKGYIAWLLLANQNGCYLIDSGVLHDEIIILQSILENADIPKFAVSIEEVMNNLKRDFAIFPINLFQLDWLSFSHQKLKEAKQTIHDAIESEMEKNKKVFVERPISKQLLGLIRKYYNIINDHLEMLPYPPIHSQDQSHSFEQYNLKIKYFYEHCNDSQWLLLPYEHQPFPVHDQTCENYNWKQESLTKLLYELREHLAKMRDLSPNLLMPNQILKQIVEENVKSILEISQIYEEYHLSVGMEVYNKIHNTIQLNEHLDQDLKGLPDDFLQKFPSTPIRQRGDSNARDVKKLLKEIEWGESSEWLNRKNDPSIRLYKEIISVNEFDESIYEEFIDQMKGDKLPKDQLQKYLKYAEYMRGKNKQKLKQYYQRKFMEQVEENEDQHLEEEEEMKKGANRALFGEEDEIMEEKKENPKLSPLKMLKSSVSLEKKLPKKDKFFFQTSKNKTKQSDTAQALLPSSMSHSRKSSDGASSQNLCDQQPDRNSIRPLPENIEQIYNQAIQAKKRITKKNTKKKDKKDHRIMKKEVEFVPTQKDICYILQLKDNNLK